jgi:chromosome segregation ATPase
MTAPLSAQRVEVIGFVLNDIKTVLSREERWAFVEAIGDAITVISDYSAMREEKITDVFVECDVLRERVKWQGTRMEKAEAENERLRAEFSTLKKAYDDECAWRGRGYRDLLTRAEKAEAKLASLTEALDTAAKAYETLKAQLAKQAPLVEEIKKHPLTWKTIFGEARVAMEVRTFSHGAEREILRAALKYREGEK